MGTSLLISTAECLHLQRATPLFNFYPHPVVVASGEGKMPFVVVSSAAPRASNSPLAPGKPFAVREYAEEQFGYQ